MSIQNPLISRLYPQSSSSPLLRTAALVVAGICLLTASAYLQIPTWPVKISLQSLVVILIGLAYGPRLGSTTVLAYLGLGALGAPVFQSGAGLAYLVGPTGGFLLGMLLSTILAGHLAERGVLNSSLATAGAVIASLVIVFIPGIAWLGVLFGPENSLAYGLIPFIPGELVKITLALALVPALRRIHGATGSEAQ